MIPWHEATHRAMKALTEKHLAIFRGHMVDVIGIHADLSSGEIGRSELDKRVLAVMRDVPRHLFVPSPVAPAAYEDTPLPIGFNKTISQPFMVALMTDLLDPQPTDHVLEVGTGLGTRRPPWLDWSRRSGASKSWRSSLNPHRSVSSA